jgi:hypothetical protein
LIVVVRFARLGLFIALLSTAGCSRAEPGNTVPNESSSTISRAEKARIMTTVEIVSGSHRWTARIDDGPAAREFLAQLPLTLSLKDYGGNEKIADLPRPLTREGAPDAVTPRAGDMAFYAPWGNLAIFYRGGHHSPGLIRLGRLQGDPADFAGAEPLPVIIRRAERSE